MNMLGLSLGMAVSLLVITVIVDQYSFDNFHQDKDRIYRVLSGNQRHMSFASSPIELGEELRKSLPEAQNIASFKVHEFSMESEQFELNAPGLIVDSEFFDVFTFPLLTGNETDIDDPTSLFVTEALGERFFGESDPMGKNLVLSDSITVVVRGVLKDVPSNSHLRFDFVISKGNAELMTSIATSSWNHFSPSYNYILLKEGADPQQTAASINRIGAPHLQAAADVTFGLQAMTDVYPGQPYVNAPGVEGIEHFIFNIMAGIAGVIMLFSIFNYASLTTARSFTRAKEIGVRKTFGAQKSQISSQVIIESISLALMSCLLAFLFLKLIIPGVYGLHPAIPGQINLEPTVKTYILFVVMAVIVGIIGGLIPAFYFSRFQPVQALTDFYNIKVFSKNGLRKTLISIQLVLGLICASTAILTYRQYSFELDFDRGYSSEGLVTINTNGNDLSVFQNELERQSSILGVSASSKVPSSSFASSSSLHRVGHDRMSIRWLYADEHFLDTYEIEILARQAADDVLIKEGQAVINETAMKKMGFKHPQEALGQVVSVVRGTYRISAVMKDVKFSGVNRLINPMIFLPFEPDILPVLMTVKLRSDDMKGGIEQMRSTWFESGMKGDFVYLDFKERYENQDVNAINSKLIGFFALQLLVVALLGLSGISRWVAETRMKELGIRRVLGAEKVGLLFQSLRGLLIMVVLAILVALPVSYLVNTEVWLNSLSHRVSFDLRIILPSILLLLIPGVLLMFLPTWHKLQKSPSSFIRSE